MSNIAYRWGQAVAVLEAATRGGFTPSCKNNAVTCPGGWWPRLLSMTVKPLPEPLAKRLAQVADGITEWPSTLSPQEQGEAQLGYWATIATLERVEDTGHGPARGSRRDWSDVDWSKKNAELAREQACTPQAVYAARKRFGN